MALQKSINTRWGLVAPNAYIKVLDVSIVEKTKGGCLIGFFASQDQTEPFDRKRIDFDYDLSGVNPIAQAYQHIKAIPEFADAIDC